MFRKILFTIGLVEALAPERFVETAEGIPVSETLAQYDVLAGQVWIFVPLTLFLAPLLFGSYLSN